MRCCLKTLADHMAQATESPKEGEILDCAYEDPGNKGMIFRDGAWFWNDKGG